jgi:hypothetical protein
MLGRTVISALLAAVAAAAAAGADREAAGASSPSLETPHASCAPVPGDLCPDLQACHVRVESGSRPVNVVWASKEYVDSTVTAEVCGAAFELGPAQGELIIIAAAGGAAGGRATVRISTPFNLLAAHYAAATHELPAGSTHRVTACSDMIDTDGDGLTDLVDPGCAAGFGADSEEGAPAGSAPSNLNLTLGAANGNVFIASLTWKGTPIIADDPSYRFYLHGDDGTMPTAPPEFGTASTKWTSDFQVYQGDIYGEPKMPWQANQSTWKAQMPPDIQEYSADMKSTVLSQNATTIVVQTTSPSIHIVDTIRLDVDPDSLYITQNITNLLTTNATTYTGLHLPNLQLGTTSRGCKCAATIWSGGPGTRADGHGQANNCTASCKTKLYHLDGLRRGAIQVSGALPVAVPTRCASEGVIMLSPARTAVRQHDHPFLPQGGCTPWVAHRRCPWQRLPRVHLRAGVCSGST